MSNRCQYCGFGFTTPALREGHEAYVVLMAWTRADGRELCAPSEGDAA